MNETFFPPDQRHFTYTGRIDFIQSDRPRLSGPGSKITFTFHGTSCTVSLKDQHRYNSHNYVVIILDGNYFQRIRLHAATTSYPVADNLEDTTHTVTICKATESQVGYFDFLGVFCPRLSEPPPPSRRLIEFIGDSITAGSSIDTTSVGCGEGNWHDQHNAWFSYGAITARHLGADWILSAVSGIGLCRYWNSELPSMIKVYDRLYMDAPAQGTWNTASQPDCVVIGLGTNDFNKGDGSYKRLPIEEVDFIGHYVRFLRKIRLRYPDVPICMLTSPVFSGEQDHLLRNYLSDIKKRIIENIAIFPFSTIYENGCDGHPGMTDHRCMADELVVFMKQFLGW